jgi:cytochrome c peroxidase
MTFVGASARAAAPGLTVLVFALGCRTPSDGAHDAAPPAIAASHAPLAPSSPPSATPFYAQRFQRKPSVPAMTDLGRQLFFDPELSASRRMACATCHDPRFAYGPPNDRPTQLGGPDLASPGLRAVPSLRYLQTLPPFAEHHFDEAVDESVDQGPTGGYAWDGRADSAHDQARAPLTSPFEMANESVDAVVAKVAQGAHAAAFREVFGDDVFADPARGANAVLLCLEVFQQSAKDFYPYSSRYDAWLRHQGELSAEEQRGLALFGDRQKGNCASCHPHEIRHGAFPQFTDYGFAALGVPRNRAIAANRDPAFFDLGLCGPVRADLAGHKAYCGMFRAPSLRNVAVRRVFFHNGIYRTLEDVLTFYAQRDSRPAKLYPGGRRFDDLPPEDRANVNREPPFGRAPGGAPALSSAEVGDLVAFLKTLTDADLAPPP